MVMLPKAVRLSECGVACAVSSPYDPGLIFPLRVSMDTVNQINLNLRHGFLETQTRVVLAVRVELLKSRRKKKYSKNKVSVE